MSGTEHRPGHVMIFNADDFGLSPAINAGIIGAYRLGPLRCTSIMPAAPAFDDAIALARRHPGLDLGIHLALTTVRPVRPPTDVPSLVTANGSFPSLRGWLARLASGAIDAEDVARELSAQVERALATGLPFSHIDGHHHIHLFPHVAPTVAVLARRHGIPFVRRVTSWRPEPGSRLPDVVRRVVLRVASGKAERAFAGLRQGVGDVRGFPFPRSLAGWRRALAALPVGTTEMMCHPGLLDPSLSAIDPLVVERVEELRQLTDPRLASLLAEADVRVGSFAALAASGEHVEWPATASRQY